MLDHVELVRSFALVSQLELPLLIDSRPPGPRDSSETQTSQIMTKQTNGEHHATTKKNNEKYYPLHQHPKHEQIKITFRAKRATTGKVTTRALMGLLSFELDYIYTYI